MKQFLASLVVLMLLLSCDRQSKLEHKEPVATSATKYTCSMHPHIVHDQPGTCPVCGMSLVPVNSRTEHLMLTETQMRLANVTTETVSKKPFGESVLLNGVLTLNESQSEVISSRISGRIEKLMIKETGVSVKKGQALYVLYSEALLTLQQEYLLAKDQYTLLGQSEPRYKSFLDAAERKLLLYGLTKAQIDNLQRGSMTPRVTFVSPATGIITKINSMEGQFVEEGTLLYKVEDMSTLWVEADLYPGESSWVKQGDKVSVKVAGFQSMALESEVSFLSPEFRSNTQILVMRAKIMNPDFQFTPGQQAQVLLTRENQRAIAIPVDAVIRDGSGSHVYVKNGHNTFKPRMVKTGVEGFDQVEILEGLSERDTVAVTGAYLLYSENVLRNGIEF